MSARLILKEIGSRINNIGTIVDTDPNNDETTSYAGKMLQGAGSFGGGFKGIGNSKDNFNPKDAASAAGAAKDVASAVSDKNLKDIDKTSTTADIIEKAYKGLDDIIYKYNSKGQALGEDDKLRAGVTAQSMEGSILECAFEICRYIYNIWLILSNKIVLSKYDFNRICIYDFIFWLN